jgi:hypothetical protein
MPPESEKPAPLGDGSRPSNNTTCAPNFTASQQVSWAATHDFVQPYLNAVGSWPMAGTVAWQLLGDTDPAKWAAILDAAQHHVLRMETAQEARCEASRAVSAAVDWPTVSQGIFARRAFREANPWAKRVTQ